MDFESVSLSSAHKWHPLFYWDNNLIVIIINGTGIYSVPAIKMLGAMSMK